MMAIDFTEIKQILTYLEDQWELEAHILQFQSANQYYKTVISSIGALVMEIDHILFSDQCLQSDRILYTHWATTSTGNESKTANIRYLHHQCSDEADIPQFCSTG